MENIMTIKAQSREGVGKQLAKKLRRQGKIPAIIYGESTDSIPISIELADVKAILKSEMGENTVLKIQLDNKKALYERRVEALVVEDNKLFSLESLKVSSLEIDAMLKEIQFDYLSDHIIHADFLRLDLAKPITVWVPIVVTGEPIGVKLEDGIFDFITREIQVKCLATKIPKKIVVEISGLHSGNSIKAENLEMGEDIQLLSDPHRAICAVTSKVKAEAEEARVELAAAAAPAEQPPKEKEDKKEDKSSG